MMMILNFINKEPSNQPNLNYIPLQDRNKQGQESGRGSKLYALQSKFPAI